MLNLKYHDLQTLLYYTAQYISLLLSRLLILEQYYISCAHPMQILPTCDIRAWTRFKWFNYHSSFKRGFNQRPSLQIHLSPLKCSILSQ